MENKDHIVLLRGKVGYLGHIKIYLLYVCKDSFHAEFYMKTIILWTIYILQQMKEKV